jgi:hypothetical protein
LVLGCFLCFFVIMLILNTKECRADGRSILNISKKLNKKPQSIGYLGLVLLETRGRNIIFPKLVANLELCSALHGGCNCRVKKECIQLFDTRCIYEDKEGKGNEKAH